MTKKKALISIQTIIYCGIISGGMALNDHYGNALILIGTICLSILGYKLFHNNRWHLLIIGLGICSLYFSMPHDNKFDGLVLSFLTSSILCWAGSMWAGDKKKSDLGWGKHMTRLILLMCIPIFMWIPAYLVGYK